MADDSWEIIEPLEFSGAGTPRGCTYYDTKYFNEEQLKNAINFKLDVLRKDEEYLKSHPEIRAIVILIINHILKIQPRFNIHKVIGEYFSRPLEKLRQEVDEYLIRTNREFEEEDIYMQTEEEEKIGEGGLEGEEDICFYKTEEEEEWSRSHEESTTTTGMIDAILNDVIDRAMHTGFKHSFATVSFASNPSTFNFVEPDIFPVAEIKSSHEFLSTIQDDLVPNQ